MRCADQFVDLIAHVNRHADGPALISDGSRDCLANPPGRIRRKFMSAMVVEFLRSADQADVAFLNQIKEGNAAADVLFCHANNESRIGADQVLPRR